MPIGRGEYVHGTKTEWPHAEAWISGPFDDTAAAFAELERVRSYYPDATLSVRAQVGRSLPIAVPRGPVVARPLTIAATGHRWERMDIPRTAAAEQHLERLAGAFLEQLRPDRVISGLALGWDTAIAQAAIRLGIPLIAALPGRRGAQERSWSWADQGTHEWLVRQAVEQHYIDVQPMRSAYLSRDQFMVDRADAIVALWSGAASGTGTTVRMAGKRGLPVVNLWGLHK